MFQTVRCICVPTIVQNMAFAIKPRESVPKKECVCVTPLTTESIVRRFDARSIAATEDSVSRLDNANVMEGTGVMAASSIPCAPTTVHHMALA